MTPRTNVAHGATRAFRNGQAGSKGLPERAQDAAGPALDGFAAASDALTSETSKQVAAAKVAQGPSGRPLSQERQAELIDEILTRAGHSLKALAQPLDQNFSDLLVESRKKLNADKPISVMDLGVKVDTGWTSVDQVRLDLVTASIDRERERLIAWPTGKTERLKLKERILSSFSEPDPIRALALETLAEVDRDPLLASIGLTIEQLRLLFAEARDPANFSAVEVWEAVAERLCYDARAAGNALFKIGRPSDPAARKAIEDLTPRLREALPSIETKGLSTSDLEALAKGVTGN